MFPSFFGNKCCYAEFISVNCLRPRPIFHAWEMRRLELFCNVELKWEISFFAVMHFDWIYYLCEYRIKGGFTWIKWEFNYFLSFFLSFFLFFFLWKRQQMRLFFIDTSFAVEKYMSKWSSSFFFLRKLIFVNMDIIDLSSLWSCICWNFESDIWKKICQVN
jgi:hypothetical protein